MNDAESLALLYYKVKYENISLEEFLKEVKK